MLSREHSALEDELCYNVVFFYCIYFSFSNGLMLSREHSALEDELCYNLKE